MSGAERRRLVQLAASVALFLMVYVGRGILPQQMAAWKNVLSADTDFKGAAEALGQAVSSGDGVLEALEAFWADVSGQGSGQGAQGEGDLLELPRPVEYLDRPVRGLGPFENVPVQSAPPAETTPEPSPEPSAEAVPSDPVPSATEPVVTAMAQEYSDTGEELPDKVSFQYYNLGLEETAVPVVGRVTSGFGFRDHPVNGVYSFHTAVDIGVPNGTDVLAYAAGTVRYIGENSIYGLYVRLDHDNNVSTFYAHCRELLVQKGDTVTCGQVIAKSGDTGNATGPHLHFSIDKDGIRLDPTYYLE